MEMDALKLALLAASSQDEAALHALHGELEHFLDRQLASEDLNAALGELVAADLVELRRELFIATDAGRAAVIEYWEDFFPA
jgi:hypothetical protein